MSLTGRRGNWIEDCGSNTKAELDLLAFLGAAANKLFHPASKDQRKLRLRRKRRKGAAFASLSAGMASPAGEESQMLHNDSEKQMFMNS